MAGVSESGPDAGPGSAGGGPVLAAARPLAEQVVAVVGASSGIGRATASLLLRAGASCALLARRGGLLEGLVAAERPGGQRVLVYPGDAAETAVAQGFVADTVARFGRLDALVFSAGLNIRRRAFGELTAEAWAGMMRANLDAAFQCTAAAVPQWRRQGGGLIVYVSSVSGRYADASGAAYQAAKRGLGGLAEALRFEEQAHGLRVSVLYPGVVNTPLVLQRPVPPTPEQLAQALQPEDVARAVAYVLTQPPHVVVPHLELRPALL